MDYKAYMLSFSGAVHFGKQSVEDGEYTFYADTLFSALFQEAWKTGENTGYKLYEYVKSGAILFSDAFPYMDQVCYLPKPVKRIELTESRGDSVTKKAYKKLKYIPMDRVGSYLKGEYDVLHAPDLKKMGQFSMRVMASVRGEDITRPYRVETYFFHENAGLYVIVGYQDQGALNLVEDLLERLSYSGIGGKRSSGMGRFVLYPMKLPTEFQRRLESKGNPCMSLSISLPRDEELERALDLSEYVLCRRGGFVSSETYAEQQMRKQDLYMLKAGSCFMERYEGDIYDVSGGIGAHPVYRYGKPMFMEVAT